jgi:hypothetical protein
MGSPLSIEGLKGKAELIKYKFRETLCYEHIQQGEQPVQVGMSREV